MDHHWVNATQTISSCALFSRDWLSGWRLWLTRHGCTGLPERHFWRRHSKSHKMLAVTRMSHRKWSETKLQPSRSGAQFDCTTENPTEFSSDFWDQSQLLLLLLNSLSQRQGWVIFVHLLQIVCLAWVGRNTFVNKISLELASWLRTLPITSF